MNIEGESALAKIKKLIELLRMNNVGSYSLFSRYKFDHAILRPFENDKPNIYVVFKTEHFHTFRYKFPEFIRENPIFSESEGESINSEALDRAINMNCEIIVFLYPHKTLYYYPLAIRTFCERKGLIRGQKRLNQFMRKDFTKGYAAEQEETYSFPADLLQPLEELTQLKSL